jgi:hypothetical protein
MLPIDMKKLAVRAKLAKIHITPGITDPNAAPEPSIVFPNVLITPFGPAPYLRMFTEPAIVSIS